MPVRNAPRRTPKVEARSRVGRVRDPQGSRTPDGANGLITPELPPGHTVAGAGSRGDRSRTTRSGHQTRIANAGVLPKGFVWYERRKGTVPPFLMGDAQKLAGAFFDFSVDKSTDGLWGSGAHLGGGFVLTAYHVIRNYLRQGDLPDNAFVGDGLKPWDQRFQVKALPARGSYDITGTDQIDPTSTEPFNDFALIHAPEAKGRGAVTGIRATADLKPGEPLWVVGDRTGGKIRVQQTLLDADQGAALPGGAVLARCDLETGFSGSPVIDAQGRLVGVVMATDDAVSFMVKSESFVALLRAAGRTHALPALPFVGFP